MPELFIHAVHTDDPGLEEPVATRDRLKDHFPKGATRRMTQLGMLVGGTLGPLSPAENDTVIYISQFAESRALESFLDSFPTASPTLFQTSIHPSAVQQSFIARQQPIREFFPIAGGPHLVTSALQVAMAAGSPRIILCGGEERGTWLQEHGAASSRTFAFALTLSLDQTGSLGRISLATGDSPDGFLSLGEFFDALHYRRSLAFPPAPGFKLDLAWS